MSTLLVLDGHSWIRRAVHTKAQRARELIFLDTVQSTLGRFRPDYFLVAIDGPRSELVRREWYPEYKANRSQTDPVDQQRIDGCVDILQASGAPVIQTPGWEADDVIATAARVCAGPRCNVVIASLDKDLGQCVTEKVELWDSRALSGVSSVKERWGVEPHQVPEVQCLAGDTSDNLPGAKGIGQKTAASYIKTFGSVPTLYDNLDKLTAVKREALKAYDWELGLRMVTLNTNLQLPLTPEGLRWSGLNMREIGEVLAGLGV